MPLRIVSWNCNMALRLKFDRLLSLRPDVAVIQECADPDGAKGWRPDCAAYDWIGFNPDKGLGIFTFGGLTLTLAVAGPCWARAITSAATGSAPPPHIESDWR